MSETTSSALALPEAAHQQSLPGANGLKRRQSEASALEQEQETKRKRTSPGKNSPTRETGDQQFDSKQGSTENRSQKEEPKEIRRKSGFGDEKQRSKRLFGALLGNLNQPGDRVSKRRTEIEQRRKAELQKQDDERLEDRQRRLERLATQRKKEQIDVDEQQIHARHRTLLGSANFLSTRTEPKLYYRPWDLLPDEEERIEIQIKEAQSQIENELTQWENEKRRRLDELDEPRIEGKAAGPSNDDGVETHGSDHHATDRPSHDKGEEDDTTRVHSGDPPKRVELLVADAETTEGVDLQTENAMETSEDQVAHADAKKANGELQEDLKNDTKDESKSQTKGEPRDYPEEEEGHVVEGDEDTVIY